MHLHKDIKRTIGLSFIATALLSSVAIAQDQTLEAVEVWETQVSSSSLNVKGSTIETKQADHLSDLLRDLPGVDVGGTSSINNRLAIRGIEDENLDITIDGAKVSNVNMFHHIGNLLVNPDILKKADIQVGTNSVVSGSLGGSVAFETKDGKDLLQDGRDYGARVQGNYNSNNSFEGSVAGYGKVSDKVDLLIYHHYVEKNEWKDGRGVGSFGTEGDVGNTLIKLGYDISDVQRITLSYDKLKDEGDYAPRPDFGKAYNQYATGNYLYPTEYNRETITLKHEVDLGDALFLQTSLYTNENQLERYEKRDGVTQVVRPVPTGMNRYEGLLDGVVQTKGINSKAQTNIQTGSIHNTFVYGGLYDVQSSKVKWSGAQYGKNEEAKTGALFVEDAIKFENGFIVTPGIRYTNYKLDGAYGKIDDNAFTYGLAAEYPLTDTFSLLASVTTLYKGVEMVDVLASNRLYMATNTDLKAETGINKEIGFKYEDKGILGADSIGFSFKVFDTTIDDYIVTTWPTSTTAVIANGGTLDIQGFESSFAYAKGAFNALVTYSKSDSKFKNTGLATQREPGDSLSINLDYALLKNLTFSWDSLFVMEETSKYIAAQNIKEAYDVHDIAVKWRPASVKGLTLIAGVDNIFDETYVSHASENRTLNGVSLADYEPGRNVKLSFAYEF